MGFAAAVRLDRGFCARLLLAGSAWGLTLAAFFFALNVRSCGLPCPGDVAALTAICVGAGLITIGPFAAIAGQHR